MMDKAELSRALDQLQRSQLFCTATPVLWADEQETPPSLGGNCIHLCRALARQVLDLQFVRDREHGNGLHRAGIASLKDGEYFCDPSLFCPPIPLATIRGRTTHRAYPRIGTSWSQVVCTTSNGPFFTIERFKPGYPAPSETYKFSRNQRLSVLSLPEDLTITARPRSRFLLEGIAGEDHMEMEWTIDGSTRMKVVRSGPNGQSRSSGTWQSVESRALLDDFVRHFGLTAAEVLKIFEEATAVQKTLSSSTRFC